MLHLGGPPLKGAPRASGLWQPSPTAVRVSLNNGAGGGGQDFRPQAVRLQEPCDELVVEAVGSTSKLIVSAEAGCSTTPSSAAVHHDVSRWVEPGQLTRRIVESQSIYDLHDLVTQHDLNSIHVSAALVKLARLIKEGQHSQDSVTDASEHHLTDRRGSHTHASTSNIALGSQTRPRPGSARHRHLPSNILASVHAMAMDLCSQYMIHVKQYTIARQHANVAWALAQLHQQAHLPVPQGVLDALSTALLHSKAYKIHSTATPQELANLTLALAKLHYSHGPLAVAIANAAQDNLLRFKPQELSNLSWGLSQAYTTLTATQHTSLGVTTAFILRDQPSPPDTAYPQLLSLQDRIAIRASQIAWQFQPCELVSVLWSAAHAGRATRHTSSLFEAALPVLQQHAHMRLLNGQDIGNSVWAYAKLGYVSWGLALLESLMATGDQHQQQQQQHWRQSRSQGKSADADTVMALQETVRRQRPQATRQGASLNAVGEAPGAWVARRCNGQELVNLMWACAMLGARPRPAAAPWTPSATAAAHQLASSILSHLVGTSSFSNGNGTGSDAHAHDMTPQGLANVAWAAARLALPDVPARVSILHKAAAQAESMSSTELSNVLWSLTSLPPWVCLDPSNRAAMTALLSALRHQIPSCQPAGIAQVAWALGWAAQACHFNSSPSDTAPHSAVPTDSDGSGMLHASSHDGPQVMPLGAEQDARAWFMAHWQPLLRAVGQHAAQGLDSFCHQDLCVLAQGLSYAYQHHPQQLLSQYSSRQQSQPQPQPHQDDAEHNGNSSSSSTAGISTGAALDPEPLFRAIGDAAVVLLQQTITAGGFSPGGLVGLLAAFTRMRAPHRELSACAARVAAARPELYSPLQLANLMWALASARVRDRQLLDRVASMLLAGPLRDLPTQSSTFGSYGYGYGYPAAGPFLQHTPSLDQPQQRRHHAPLAPAVVGVEVDKGFGNEVLDTGEKCVQGRGEALTEEEEEEGPRGNASSLLRQLGWEDEDEDVDDHHQNGLPQPGVNGGKRRHTSGWQGARAGPREAEEDLTNATAPQGQPMQARRSQRRSSSNGMQADQPQQHPQQQDQRDHQRDWQQQLYAEPACSSPAMVWTVLTWAFARSNYHQHELYERLTAAVLTGGVMMSTGMQGTASTDFPSPASPRRALAQLTTPCLVQLLWALAAHDHPHPLLLREAAPVLAARIRRGHMRPRDVATVTWAYARLQQYEPVLFNAVLRETQTHSSRYNLRMWSRLTWAFSTLCLPSEEAFFLRLAQLQRQDAAAAARRQQQQQQKQQHQLRTVSPSPAPSQSPSPQPQPCSSSPSPPHAVNSHSSGWNDTHDSSGLSWAWAPTSASTSPSHTVMTAMGVGTWTDVTAHDAAAAEQEWLSSSPGMPYRSAHDMINEPTAGGAWVGAVGGDVQLVAKPMRKTPGLNGSSATVADSNSQQQAAGITDVVQQ